MSSLPRPFSKGPKQPYPIKNHNMTTFKPPYRAAHPSITPYTSASSHRTPRPTPPPLQFMHTGYTKPSELHIEAVRAWQLQQFSTAHARGLDVDGFESDLPPRESNWFSRSHRNLKTAEQLNDHFRAEQARSRRADRKIREKELRDERSARRRERVLREELFRAQEEGRRMGEGERVGEERRREGEERRAEEQRVREEAYETLLERARRERARKARERSREAGRKAAEEWGREREAWGRRNPNPTARRGARDAHHNQRAEGRRDRNPGRNPAFEEVSDEEVPPNRGSRDGELFEEILLPRKRERPAPTSSNSSRASSAKGDERDGRTAAASRAKNGRRTTFEDLPDEEQDVPPNRGSRDGELLEEIFPPHFRAAKDPAMPPRSNPRNAHPLPSPKAPPRPNKLQSALKGGRDAAASHAKRGRYATFEDFSDDEIAPPNPGSSDGVLMTEMSPTKASREEKRKTGGKRPVRFAAFEEVADEEPKPPNVGVKGGELLSEVVGTREVVPPTISERRRRKTLVRNTKVSDDLLHPPNFESTREPLLPETEEPRSSTPSTSERKRWERSTRNTTFEDVPDDEPQPPHVGTKGGDLLSEVSPILSPAQNSTNYYPNPHPDNHHPKSHTHESPFYFSPEGRALRTKFNDERYAALRASHFQTASEYTNILSQLSQQSTTEWKAAEVAWKSDRFTRTNRTDIPDSDQQPKDGSHHRPLSRFQLSAEGQELLAKQAEESLEAVRERRDLAAPFERKQKQWEAMAKAERGWKEAEEIWERENPVGEEEVLYPRLPLALLGKESGMPDDHLRTDPLSTSPSSGEGEKPRTEESLNIAQLIALLLREPVPPRDEGIPHSDSGMLKILSPSEIQGYHAQIQILQENLISRTAESSAVRNVMDAILQYDWVHDRTLHDLFEARAQSIRQKAEERNDGDKSEKSPEALRFLEGNGGVVQEIFREYWGKMVEFAGSIEEEDGEDGLLRERFYEIRGAWREKLEDFEGSVGEEWEAMKEEWGREKRGSTHRSDESEGESEEVEKGSDSEEEEL